MTMEQNNPEVEVEVPEGDEPADNGVQGGAAGSFQEKAARLLKLKIDGEEMELPEDEVIKYAQMGKKANKTMQEAQQEKKRMMRLNEMARQDPMALLRELNPEFDEDDYVSKKLERQIERNMKSKEEQERDDAIEELRRYKQKEADQSKAKEDEDFDKLVVESRNRLDKEISEALQSISMKPSKASVKRLASYLLMAKNENLNLSAKDLAPMVKQDMIAEYMEQLELSDDDTFASMMGEKNLTRSQKIALAKLKKAPTNNAPKTTVTSLRDKEEPRSERNYDIQGFLKEHLKNK